MNEENLDKRLNTMKDSLIIKRLLSYAKPYTLNFINTIILMVISVLAGLAEPYLTGKSIDTINSSNIDLNQLFTYLAYFVLAIIIGNVLNFVQTMILQKTGQSIIYNIREEIFTHLEYHDIAYLNNTPTGALVTRVTNDTNTLNEMYTNVIVSVFRNVTMILLIIVFIKVLILV